MISPSNMGSHEIRQSRRKPFSAPAALVDDKWMSSMAGFWQDTAILI
ncbi:unnamed protein product [Staurois parvus]|uniref:Uncharacterized protein n=1 Tax=Staurois parvus TaxID=386267 RepID=A0ABN9C8H8_9NEOB|nr:unnamed protein product [Staurois parvus]